MPTMTENETTGEQSRSSGVSPIVVGSVVTTVILLVTVAVVIVLVVVVVARNKKQTKTQTDPGDGSYKTTRGQSKSNYTSTNEEVSGNEEHDYELIGIVSVRPQEGPDNYAIPQTSSSKPSSSQSSSAYEAPGHVTSTHASGPVRGSVSAVEYGYDTPVCEHKPHTQHNTGESGYDPPIDAQKLPNSKTAMGVGVYETPVHVDYVYEEVDCAP